MSTEGAQDTSEEQSETTERTDETEEQAAEPSKEQGPPEEGKEELQPPPDEDVLYRDQGIEGIWGSDEDQRRGDTPDSSWGAEPLEHLSESAGEAAFPEKLPWRQWQAEEGSDEERPEEETVEEEVTEEGEGEVEPVLTVAVSEPSPEPSERTPGPPSHVYKTLSPFGVKWTFGCSKAVKLLNLTSYDRYEVFFVSGHLGVIYDYRRHSMHFLPGHNYHVTSTSSDESGRWLVTADAGPDTAIIVWDNRRRTPVWSIFNPFPGEGTRCVQLSQDARFLAAASWGPRHVVKFWLWTLGSETADAVLDVSPEFGLVKHIAFNHRATEMFAVTTETKVTFCRWDEATRVLATHVAGIKRHRGPLGVFRETLFLDDNHTVITATGRGQAVVWTDVPYTTAVEDCTDITITKMYLKTIRLQRTAINSIGLVDGLVVTCSEGGVISYHDQSLKLIYWLPRFRFEPLVSVSYHRVPRSDLQMDPFHPEFDDNRSSKRSTSTEEMDLLGWMEGEEEGDGEEWFGGGFDSQEFKGVSTTPREGSATPSERTHVPSDCTIRLRPLLLRDFVFLSVKGRIGYVSNVRTKLRFLLYTCEHPVLSLDCNPNKPHLVTGDSAGRLALYETKAKELLLAPVVADCGVTCLRYSPRGDVLTAGLHSGDVLVLDPNVLDLRHRISNTHAPIVHICFSPNGRLFAHSDEAYAVSLYAESLDKKNWTFMGKYISHYKPIRDLMFENQPASPDAARLFSLGEDRMLVEYDTRNLEEGSLKVISIDRVEQTAVPQCFAWLPVFYDAEKFVIANSEFKLKVVEKESKVCWKTTLGPTADIPVQFLRLLPGSEMEEKRAYMVYVTRKTLGLRLAPPTGNPFEDMAICGHPEGIRRVAVSHHSKHAFTAGLNDGAVLMWKLNRKAVLVAQQLGGDYLDPFMPLIEGGEDGFLYQEIRDMFHYAQIVHQGELPNVPRQASRSLALCEVPDFLRALGYFPTEYEIGNILYELSHCDFEETMKVLDETTFLELVKAYVNHRPVQGIALEQVTRALMTIGDLRDPQHPTVGRDPLMAALEDQTEKVEALTRAEAVGYLNILLTPEDPTKPLPPFMEVEEFTQNLLGIDFTITEQTVRNITHAFRMEKDYT